MARILPGQKKLEKAGFGTAPQERALMDVVGVTPGGVGGQQDQSTTQEKNAAPQQVFTPGSGSGSSSTQSTAPKQTKGSGYTNIQRILKASGTEGGPTRLAQAVTGGIQQQTTGAEQALKDVESQFGEKIDKTRTGFVAKKGQAGGALTTASAGGALSAEDIQNFQDVVGGAYTGPEGLSFNPSQRRKAAESAALAKLAGGTEGRAALLQKYVGAPQYGQSKQTLDALLLGKGGSAEIRGALKKGAQAESDIARQEAAAIEQARALSRAFAGSAEEIKTQLNQRKNELIGGIEAEKQRFLDQDIERAVARISNALFQGGDVRRSDLNLLNLKEEDFSNLKYAQGVAGMDIKGVTDAIRNIYKSGNIGSFATAQQRAAAGALGQLAQQDTLGIQGLAGDVYSIDPNQEAYFNLGQFKQDVENKIQENLNTQQEQINMFGDRLGNISYIESDPISAFGDLLGIEGPTTLNLNNIADSIVIKPGAMGIPSYNKNFEDVKKEINAKLDSLQPNELSFITASGKRFTVPPGVGGEVAAAWRRNAVEHLAELVFQKAEQRFKYNQTANAPALRFNFID